jgi:predicted Zn-dependent protease
MCSILVRRMKRSGRLALVLALLSVAACRAPEERAARYAGMYEAALAGNDPWTARLAMQRAVAIDDSNPQYWAALGRVQLTLGDYPGAYAAFVRANELDRSNANIIQTLADLAALSGRAEDARRYANQVLLLLPSDPAPQATLGFVALHDRDFDTALKRADTVLAARPDDSNATILKARALASSGDPDQSLKLLAQFTAAHPRDGAALDTMVTVARRFRRLPELAAAREKLVALRPHDAALRVGYAGSLYALGQHERARALTEQLIREGDYGDSLIDVLALWRRYEPRDWSVPTVRTLAATAGVRDRLRYAYFLMLSGAPADAESLVAPMARPPVTATNASVLALLAQIRAARGRDSEAESLLNQVLAFDQSNVVALRARADLYLRTGRARQAVFDAQKLVAEKTRAPDDRVRLARAYQGAKQPQLAENALRAGLQEIQGDPLLYDELRKFLVAAGRRDELDELGQQFVEQQRLARAQW